MGVARDTGGQPAAAGGPARGARALAAPGADLIGLSPSRRFIPELESLRGIAILLVFTFHVHGFVLYPFSLLAPRDVSLPMAYIRSGQTGVDLFFVLSAFLLARPFLDEGRGGKVVRRRDYFLRRALRILPLYWTAVLVATVLSASTPYYLLRAIPHMLFLTAVPGIVNLLPPYGGVWWSLVTEAEFYLLLPLLPLALSTPWGRRVGLAVLALYAAFYVAAMLGGIAGWSVPTQFAFWHSLLGRGPVFLCGIAAAVWYVRFGPAAQERMAATAWWRNGGADALLVATLIAIGLVLQWLVRRPEVQFQSLHQWWHPVTGALWTVVLLLLLVAPLRTKRLFCNAPLAKLGVLSYSIYLVHGPFMFVSIQAFVGRRAWTPWAWALVTVLSVALLACCSLTYRFIERPFLVRKARFGG